METDMKIAQDCVKVCKVIESCDTQEQFDTAVEMAYRFAEVYKLKDDESLAPYTDVLNETIEEIEGKLECQKEEARPKIGFLR
jgi:hypothetical protein